MYWTFLPVWFGQNSSGLRIVKINGLLASQLYNFWATDEGTVAFFYSSSVSLFSIYLHIIHLWGNPRKMEEWDSKWTAHFILYDAISLQEHQPVPSAEPPGTNTNPPFNHPCGLMTLSNSTLAECHSRHQPGMPNTSSDNRFRFIFHEQKHCSGLLTGKST